MQEADARLFLINTATFTMAEVEVFLKILLLLFSIGYTAQRWYVLNRKR
jgi:hypothetical protein